MKGILFKTSDLRTQLFSELFFIPTNVSSGTYFVSRETFDVHRFSLDGRTLR